MPLLSPDLVDILACPVCKGRLVQDEAARQLVCRACSLGYPIREHEGRALPVMLPEEAERLAPDNAARPPTTPSPQPHRSRT